MSQITFKCIISEFLLIFRTLQRRCRYGIQFLLHYKILILVFHYKAKENKLYRINSKIQYNVTIVISNSKIVWADQDEVDSVCLDCLCVRDPFTG